MHGVASLRRIALLSLLSIPVAAEVILGEVLFVGHIVFLVEVLGFAWGLLAFTAIWAALGLAVLAGRDFVWPRLAPLLDSLLARFASRASDVKAILAVLGVSSALAAAGVAIALAGSEIWDWTVDHRADVATFLIVAAVIFPILLVIARLGRSLEKWIRSIADTASPAMRSFAALVSMMLLGPALSWLPFRLLGYSGRAVYALTLVAAPVFGAIWVPFYGLGVWAVIEGSL
jgi:hypothetical protein